MPACGYEDYLARYEAASRLADRARKRLAPEDHERLSREYERLLARMDPDDIQLDEWKRAEELRFLLLIGGEEQD